MSERGVPGDRWQERVLDRLFSVQKNEESQAGFARRLGLQPQHLSNYRQGRHGLSLKSAIRISRNTGLSLDWLLLGRGDPFREGNGDSSSGSSGGIPSGGAATDELRSLTSALLARVRELEEREEVDPDAAERFRDSLDLLVKTEAA